MTEQLKRLRSYEVSFVPRGANLKKFLILKEDSEMAKSAVAQHVEKLIAKMALKNETKIDAILKELSDDDKNALKAALKVVQAMGDKIDPIVAHELMEAIGMIPEEGPEGSAADTDMDGETDIEKVKKAYHAMKAAHDAAIAKLGNPPPPAQPDSAYPVTKEGKLDLEKVPENLRPVLSKLWDADQRLAKVTKELEDQRDRAVTKEYQEQAEKEFSKLPIKKEDLGQVLKAVALKAPDHFDAVKKVLKAANDVMDKSGATVELGTKMPRSGSVATESADASYQSSIVAPAIAQPIAKEKGWNEDEAVTHFITKTAEGRRAYAEYRDEQQAQQRRA